MRYVFSVSIYRKPICNLIVNQYFSDNLDNFFFILVNSLLPNQDFDDRNVNHFSTFFSPNSHFMTSVQNLCSLFHYVNHKNPQWILWTMWITLRITPLLLLFVDFSMWITLRIIFSTFSTFRHSLCIFYKREYSDNFSSILSRIFRIFSPALCFFWMYSHLCNLIIFSCKPYFPVHKKDPANACCRCGVLFLNTFTVYHLLLLNLT